ncbi:hypothetical protein BC941DRAFT_408967 [Chlamydoabsidia padenii]|nr:hypothetical protein BC941DRAFT_408967 [Chlamydoabsidia padenii]
MQTSSLTQLPYSLSSSMSIIPPPTTILSSSPDIIDPSPEELSSLSIDVNPLITPLTETNLGYHKLNFPSSRETKLCYVDSYIQQQKALVKRELELQQETQAEIQSMIPLDTTCSNDELVRDDITQLYDTQSTSPQHTIQQSPTTPAQAIDQKRRHSLLTHLWFSSDHPPSHNKTTTTMTLKGRLTSLTRWFGIGKDDHTHYQVTATPTKHVSWSPNSFVEASSPHHKSGFLSIHTKSLLSGNSNKKKKKSIRHKVDPDSVDWKQEDNLVAFRYPKMVRMKDLREQVNLLQQPDFGSILMTFGQEEDRSIDDEEQEQEDSLVKYSRQYRNHAKRLSDPGTGLSAPPFPIGRPLSSFYV